jgi:hypothetical protein
MYELLYSKIKSKTIKMPVFAGMQYAHGKIINAKMSLVAHDYFLHTYQVHYYTNNHEDWELIGSKRIKRTFIKRTQ